MATSTPVFVPLAEYLETTYRPDRDWIDGEAKERNVGEQPHASVQGFLTYIFRLNAAKWNIRVLPEQRVQTSAKHYRIADVCVILRSTPFEPIVRPRRPHERDSGASRGLSGNGRAGGVGDRSAPKTGV